MLWSRLLVPQNACFICLEMELRRISGEARQCSPCTRCSTHAFPGTSRLGHTPAHSAGLSAPNALFALQALGGVPGSQPLLPSGMDPTRQQGDLPEVHLPFGSALPSVNSSLILPVFGSGRAKQFQPTLSCAR